MINQQNSKSKLAKKEPFLTDIVCCSKTENKDNKTCANLKFKLFRNKLSLSLKFQQEKEIKDSRLQARMKDLVYFPLLCKGEITYSTLN